MSTRRQSKFSPEEEDCFITDKTSGGYDVSCGGKYKKHFSDFNDAMTFIREWMNENRFYPNIWTVNERGTVDLLTGNRKRSRRKKAYIPPASEQLTIIKGECMSRKRHSRKMHGFEGRRHKRHSRRYYGGDKVSPMNTLINGAVAVGGGVAASMAAHYIPVANLKIKAGIPIAIGALLAMLPMTRRNKTIQAVALGSVVVGAMSLVRQMAPNIPLLTGDMYTGSELLVPSYGEADAMQGLGYVMNGEPMDVSGDLDGYEGDLD
jgi:hypothetical protein